MNLVDPDAVVAESVDEHPRKAALSADSVARLHSAFLVAFGAWPNLHMRSFEAVTGKKYDTWLVRSVGLLLITAGSAIALARRNGRVPASARVLGLGVSTSLGAISLTYASKGRIPPIYFLDSALHAAFAAAWVASSRDDVRAALAALGARHSERARAPG